MPRTKKADQKHHQTSRVFVNDRVRVAPEACIRNGDYQSIFWLGVAGYVIVNHPDREIVLVDPWPTCASPWTAEVPLCDGRPLTNKASDPKKRIEELANFLRRSAALDAPYKVSAILLSHDHFDHTDDVALLLELLHSREGGLRVRKSLDFSLEGPPIPLNKLPVICADFDTIFYLKTQFFGVYWRTLFSSSAEANQYWVGKQAQARYLNKIEASDSPEWRAVARRYGGVGINGAWQEVTQAGARRYYNDMFNEKVLKGKRSSERPTPGTVADLLALKGSAFHITPYIWDHMNTPFMFMHDNDALDDLKNGSRQRITAYLIERKDVDGAKRTFIVGSAGEMSKPHTKPAPKRPSIQTDLLIQATTADGVNKVPFIDYPLKKIMHECREFTFCNISVNDYLVLSHFEEFTRASADKKTFEKNCKDMLTDNIEGLTRLIGDKKSKLLSPNRRLLENNAMFVLKRRGTGFEAEMPRDATEV